MKRYKVVDPNFKIKACLYLDSIKEYRSISGKTRYWYRLKYKPDDIISLYFGEHQIKEVNVKNNRF